MEINDILGGRLVYSSRVTDSRLREWILNSTRLTVRYYTKAALTVPDEVVCRVLLDAGGRLDKEELGLTLGYDVATRDFNGRRYYRDNAERGLFLRLIDSVEKWHLVVYEAPKGDVVTEEDDDDWLFFLEESADDVTDEKKESLKKSVVRLTPLGVLALQRHEKYSFYKSQSLLYSNQLNIHDIDRDKTFPFKEELGIATSLSSEAVDMGVDPDTVDIDATSEWIDRLKRQLDEIGDKHIYSVTPSMDDSPLKITNVDIRLYEYEGEYYPLVFSGETLCPEATGILMRNASAKEVKIKRAFYYKLVNDPEAVFNSKEVKVFWDILEKDEFNSLLGDRRLEWDDAVLFDMIAASEYCDVAAWEAVSKTCPTEVIKSHIDKYRKHFDWVVLSQRLDVDYILCHPLYTWSYGTVLSRDDVSQEQGQAIMLIPTEEEWEWDAVSRYLTPEFVRENIGRLGSGLFYDMTSWLSADDYDIVIAHPDKPWDYDYLTKAFSLPEIERWEVLQERIKIGKLLDRCFSAEADAEERDFFLNSQALRAMTAAAAQTRRLSSYTLRDKAFYLWSDAVIEFFESTGLLQWQSKSVEKGFCRYPFVHWDAEFFSKYCHKLTTADDIAYVCGAISDGRLIASHTDFGWDWRSLSSNRQIALDGQFIETYAGKIDAQAWLKIATTELVEKYFDTLHLERSLRTEHADDLSEKVSATFLLSRIALRWGALQLTRAICGVETGTVELIEDNAWRIDWVEASWDIDYDSFAKLAGRYAIWFDWDAINNRFADMYDSGLLSIEAVQDKVDWGAVTARVAMGELEKLVYSHPDRIDWQEATRRLCPMMTMPLLIDNAERWDWQYLSENVAMALIEKGIAEGSLRWDWHVVTQRLDPYFIFDNLADYEDKWDYDILDERLTGDLLRERMEEIPDKISALTDEALRGRFWTVATGKLSGDELLSTVDSHNPEQGYHWDYSQVYKYVDDINDFVDTSHAYIDWQALSGSSAADKYFAYDPDFNYLLWKSMAKKRINNKRCQWDFQQLTKLNSIQERFPVIYDMHEEGWDWSYLSVKGLCFTKKSNGEANIRKFRDKIDFALLSTRNDIGFNESLLESFISERWDWGALSANNSTHVSIAFVFQHIDRAWDWHALPGNASIKWGKDAQRYCVKIVKNKSVCVAFDWESFVGRTDVVFDADLIAVIHEYIADYWQKLTSNKRLIPSVRALGIAEEDGVDMSTLNWDTVSLSPHIIEGKKQDDLKFIKKYAVYLDWQTVTRNAMFDINNVAIVEQFKEHVDWNYISSRCDIDNMAYLCHFKAWLDWASINPQLDYKHVTGYLDELKDYLDWTRVSAMNMDFTEELVDKYAKYWDWTTLVNNASFNAVFSGKIRERYKPQYNVARFYNLFSSRREPKIYHFSHLFNVIDILRSRKILSRDSAERQGLLKNDSAGDVVYRSSKAHGYARFYFRPKTTTQFYNECLGWDADSSILLGKKRYSYYSGALGMGLPKCPLPVFLEFDLREVLTKMPDRCYYSDGNMQASYTSVYKVEDEPSYLKTTYLYKNIGDAYGMAFIVDDDGNYWDWDRELYEQIKDSIKHQSQQEFLVEGEFDFSNIQSLRIHCFDEFSANMLRRYLHEDTIMASKIDVDGSCFLRQNRQLTFKIVGDSEDLDISSDYNGQGDAYFRVEGDVEIVNDDNVKRQTADGIIAYPEIRIKRTSNPYKVFFIDERARNKEWLIYQN